MTKEVEFQFFFSSEEHFGRFFRQNYHIACLVALRYVKTFDVAEDLVQDVFVALWEKRENLHVRSDLRSYLFTAVKNHAINLVLRNKSATISLSELFIDLPEEDNLNSFRKEEQALRVFNAIQELPKGCQTIFKLAYEQNFTYQEIADALQISKNTVKTQMGIAYKQLREKLEILIFNMLILFIKK